MTTFVCRACAATYPLDQPVWRCECGGLLDLQTTPAQPLVVETQRWSMWRYRSALPFSPHADAWEAVTMGEGMTPLLPESPGVYVKADFVMPTLSFKDRGSAVMVGKAAEIGVRRLVVDSSGNAGISISAYARRAGIDAEVFVPASTSAAKVGQLAAYGARIRQISGSREDAADEAMQRVVATGAYYASHVYNPLFHHGTKTFAYELWEQLGGDAPGTVVIPAGNGTLLLGAAVGFSDLLASGQASRVPRLIAVQAARCAPVAAAWRHQSEEVWSPTVAEGIAIARPARLEQMLDAVAGSDGTFVTVSDAEIMESRTMLRSRGIDLELTAAATWAGWRAWPGAGETPRPVVIALTGAGLKTPGNS